MQSNRSAIGGRVTLTYGGRKQVQEVLSQSSFYSVNDFRLHFGLGAEWRVERLKNVAANRLILIREGTGIVKATPFPAK